MNILITSAGRRVSLVQAFQKELKKLFPDGKVFTVDMIPELSSACRASDGYFNIVRVTDNTYCNRLIDICLANNIKLIVPTIDTELIPLAENDSLINENGIIPLISSLEMVRICRDKRKLFKFFDSINFPRTSEVNIHDPDFPIFIKPVDGSSSNGIRIITEKSQLKENEFENDKYVFLKYLNPKEYAEFTVDMYFDKSSILKCAVPRERLEIRSGEVSKSVTRKGSIYTKILRQFSFLEGFVGCITLQVFINRRTNEILGIEINPRFGGGYPLSYHAGANFPEYIIREYLLNEPIQFFDHWICDLLMLRFDAEVLVNDYKG
jgi:carbamoyl-phosphate synthase large subunit